MAFTLASQPSWVLSPVCYSVSSALHFLQCVTFNCLQHVSMYLQCVSNNIVSLSTAVGWGRDTRLMCHTETWAVAPQSHLHVGVTWIVAAINGDKDWWEGGARDCPFILFVPGKFCLISTKVSRSLQPSIAIVYYTVDLSVGMTYNTAQCSTIQENVIHALIWWKFHICSHTNRD